MTQYDRLTFNQWVTGSNPVRLTTEINDLAGFAMAPILLGLLMGYIVCAKIAKEKCFCKPSLTTGGGQNTDSLNLSKITYSHFFAKRLTNVGLL